MAEGQEVLAAKNQLPGMGAKGFPSRPEGSGRRPEGYFDDQGFGDFEEDYPPAFEGHFPPHSDMGFHHPMDSFDPSRLSHDQQKSEHGMKLDPKDHDMINPLLYKPASKPPVIREGDWLCPSAAVSEIVT